tara:strand:+ start:184 stop:369 length:186 start_codon:yes stop_codon:yes gene_type:complete
VKCICISRDESLYIDILSTFRDNENKKDVVVVTNNQVQFIIENGNILVKVQNFVGWGSHPA